LLALRRSLRAARRDRGVRSECRGRTRSVRHRRGVRVGEKRENRRCSSPTQRGQIGLQRVDLYQLHWADFEEVSIDDAMSAFAEIVHAGQASAVGVSNFRAAEMRQAHAALAERGVPLASNQVHYSLLHRSPEVDGVLDACRELNVTLLSYSPLEQGLLTGKYDAAVVPVDGRAEAGWFSAGNVSAAQSVVGALRAIGQRYRAA